MARFSEQASTQKRLELLLDEGTFLGLTDLALLDRLTATDARSAAAAFAALVARHGPMVLRVRNQVLEDPHDAEDAFQATFLVLFRQAISIRNWGSLATNQHCSGASWTPLQAWGHVSNLHMSDSAVVNPARGSPLARLVIVGMTSL